MISNPVRPVCALRLHVAPIIVAVISACSRAAPCTGCDRLVIAATGEPSSVLPPLAYETVGRDIGDQVYERLANSSPATRQAIPPGTRRGLPRAGNESIR